VYEDVFRIRSWKGRLPDGADLLRWRSFRKRTLAERTPAYLERFSRETCRAELTHLLTMAWAPAFFLWNPVWVGWLMIAYALAENVPPILAQRYNRCRLASALRRGLRRGPVAAVPVR
jgi:glycosyl-4,4'-diaponeurosporenoate acyltransferase